MIQYQLLRINRIIFHRIFPKTHTRAHVEADFNNSLIEADGNMQNFLRKRLVNSCGRQTKSFELSIENDTDDSVFSYLKNLSRCTDERFIEISQDLAQKLADLQDEKLNIPGGYFLLIEAITAAPLEHNVYIILKAEKQDALSDEGGTIELNQNIFLSPALKMYKAGVFEQINEKEDLTKEDFKAYLFDSQFNDGRKLAEYFYKDYLGLTINGNSPVETKTFYTLFNDTIDSVFKKDIQLKNHSKELLQCEMENQTSSIFAHDIVERIIPEDKRDKFIAKVVERFPNSFQKDCSLIEKRMQNMSYYVTDSVRLYAPSQLFSNNIISISNDPDNEDVKIIKVRVNEN